MELYKKLHYRTFENNLKDYDDSKLIKLYYDYNIKLLDDLHILLDVKWFDTDLLTKLQANKKEISIPFTIPDDLYKNMSQK